MVVLLLAEDEDPQQFSMSRPVSVSEFLQPGNSEAQVLHKVVVGCGRDLFLPGEVNVLLLQFFCCIFFLYTNVCENVPVCNCLKVSLLVHCLFRMIHLYAM